MILGISPEGTRQKVKKWKTGFYYIALESRVPILLAGLDYKKKEIGIIGELLHTPVTTSPYFGSLSFML